MGRMQCLQSAVSAPAHWSISSTCLHARPRTDAVKLKVSKLHEFLKAAVHHCKGAIGLISFCTQYVRMQCLPCCSNVVWHQCGMQTCASLCFTRDSFVIVAYVVQGHLHIPYDVPQ